MNLILCRSDAGDGGWSLHGEGTMDEEIADGVALILSGSARMVGGKWDRPDVRDYARAHRRGPGKPAIISADRKGRLTGL